MRAHAQIGPAMARAQADMVRAQAALAGAPWSGVVAWGPGWASTWDEDYDRTPPLPWAQGDPADQLYRDARRALNRSRYDSAAGLFEQIYTKYPKSTYAGDAYYWQAYALSKRDNDVSLKRAIEVLRLQKSKAPNASTRRDADELRTRIEGRLAMGGNADAAERIAATAVAAAGPGNPPGVPPIPPGPPRAVAAPHIAGGHGRRDDACGDDDDMQMSALNALLNMDADRAIPILKKVLARRDEGSLCLRRKAVFMVSQHESGETEQILLDAARTDPDQEVRSQAVFWLSQTNSPRVVPLIDSILRSATDPVLQEKAIFALSQQNSPRARQALRDYALRGGVSDDLREKAIFWISQGSEPDRFEFLKSLYGQMKTEALRDKILFAMSQIDSQESRQWLLQIAGDERETIDLRKKALFWVGQSNYPGPELYALYEKMPNKEMKEQLIFVFSQRNERSAVDKLFEIARGETDRELRKKALFWLSQSNDPRVPEFLAKILEKP
jgi:HEAT repeat protein